MQRGIRQSVLGGIVNGFVVFVFLDFNDALYFDSLFFNLRFRNFGGDGGARRRRIDRRAVAIFCKRFARKNQRGQPNSRRLENRDGFWNRCGLRLRFGFERDRLRRCWTSRVARIFGIGESMSAAAAAARPAASSLALFALLRGALSFSISAIFASGCCC